MSDPIDRRTMLASSLAWAAVALSGCGSSNDSPACGGTGGTGAGGGAGTGGSTYACMNTMTGSHMHPLSIPGGAIADGTATGMPYTLQDCGTGHTHTLELSVYDVAFLQAGTTVMVDSSTTQNHLHTVSITCTMS